MTESVDLSQIADSVQKASQLLEEADELLAKVKTDVEEAAEKTSGDTGKEARDLQSAVTEMRSRLEKLYYDYRFFRYSIYGDDPTKSAIEILKKLKEVRGTSQPIMPAEELAEMLTVMVAYPVEEYSDIEGLIEALNSEYESTVGSIAIWNEERDDYVGIDEAIEDWEALDRGNNDGGHLTDIERCYEQQYKNLGLAPHFS